MRNKQHKTHFNRITFAFCYYICMFVICSQTTHNSTGVIKIKRQLFVFKVKIVRDMITVVLELYHQVHVHMFYRQFAYLVH